MPYGREMHTAMDHLLFYCRPKEAEMSRSTFLNKIKAAFWLLGGVPETAGHGDVGND